MRNTTTETIDLTRVIFEGALEGRNAHVRPSNVLEGLKLDITGKKILNTPYTIWQCLKHVNYWQKKFIRRLEGQSVKMDASWKEGWEEKLNACSQAELDHEIELFELGIDKVKRLLNDVEQPVDYKILQAMASHISYHMGEIVLLRRIFGAWPPKSGGMVW